MKKHELLKHAYDNYPKGTKFMGAGSEEFVSSGCFNIVNGNILKDNYGLVYNSDTNKWAEIIAEEKPKSILDGKVAIQVNNKREFNLLMGHYESKGWSTKGYSYYHFNKFAEYKDDFYFFSTELYGENNSYTIIQFADFAKEVGIEVPRFIMKSEDGVELYEGDEIHEAIKQSYDKIWRLNATIWKAGSSKNSRWIVMSEESKAFHSKENALKWIDEHNKPKEINLFENELLTVKINKDGFISTYNETINTVVHKFTGEELEQIYKAYKSLK